ncbi:hypothetical protein tb265_10490 [Gemmatimonadetes bacterium T265]|nr:hypothetical protein tb265_10490 [Gemmatimonadetes bacterium T265]
MLDALPFAVWTADGGLRATGGNAAWARLAADPAARAALGRAAARARDQSSPARCTLSSPARTLRVDVAPLGDAQFVCSAVELSEPRASSPPGATPARRAREALIDAGLALSRTLDIDGVHQEVARQARRALGADAIAVAAADDETAALRLTHRAGWADERDSDLERRLAPAWLEALATRRVVERTDGEFTAPATTSDGALGALTVRVPNADADEAARLLDTFAAQTAVAVERAWLVRRVEQKRRLEAIGEVAAGVAHELRNPLFGISSAAQLLGFRAGDDPAVEKNVGRILREAERLNRIIAALLDYGRPAAARLAPGDPDALWDDVLDAQRARLDAKRLTLERRRADGVAARRFDAEQLRQVFLNVLGNAVDAAPEGSTLTLAAAVLPNGAWRCHLHNGGPAVPAESLARVFELFYSTKPGGTGIGLALCRRVMDEHGGAITIESAPEAGTTVAVTLPPAPP